MERGEPGKYYPTGVRTYFRILPNDHVQAAALVTAMRDRGCKALAFVHDGEVYGKGMNTDAVATAARFGLPVVANRRISRSAPSAIRRAKADCMAYTGITANGAVRLFRVQRPARDAALRQRRRGRDGLRRAPAAFGLPPHVRDRRDAARRRHQFGNRDPYFVYGYEAMKLILDGLAASGGTRAGLLGWLPTVQNRPSVLGTYGFDANGDTTLRTLRALRRHPQGRPRLRRHDHRRLSSSSPSSSSTASHSPSGRGSSASPRSRTATNTWASPRVKATTSSPASTGS